MSNAKEIQSRLNRARQELLDLGLRNPLLNFRPMRARGISFRSTDPNPIFDHFVMQEKWLGFAAQSTETNEEGEGAETGKSDASLLDMVSRYEAAELHKRLVYSQNLAETMIQEQGINVLYLALGMLKWYDKQDSGRKKPHFAPLLLIPARLTNHRRQIRLTYTGVDWGSNLSLRAKLALDFDIDLPEPDLEQAFAPTVYFDRVASAIEGQSDWQIERDRVELGFFSFNKFSALQRPRSGQLAPIDAAGRSPAAGRSAQRPTL